MIIEDVRNHHKITLENLFTGDVVQNEGGVILIVTDESSLVNLATGFLHQFSDCKDATFTKLSAKLIIT